MSTNSLVAYLNEDGSVVSSYVHYDGYATGVGEMLLEHYNSDKLARDLAWCLGYASSLKETISESHEDRAIRMRPKPMNHAKILKNTFVSVVILNMFMFGILTKMNG